MTNSADSIIYDAGSSSNLQFKITKGLKVKPSSSYALTPAFVDGTDTTNPLTDNDGFSFTTDD